MAADAATSRALRAGRPDSFTTPRTRRKGVEGERAARALRAKEPARR